MTKTMFNARTVLLLGVLAAATLTASARASDWGFSFGYGRQYSDCAPRPATRQWVPDRYETRCEQVLVCPARYERRYVEPCYVTRYDRCGYPYRVCSSPGYWREVYVPARYETRNVSARVPGYYRDSGYDSYSNDYYRSSSAGRYYGSAGQCGR